MTVNKPSYQELEKRIQELENESLERRRIEAEFLEKHSILRKQNINLVRKSIELSDIKIQLEDKNYELESIRCELRKQNIDLVRKSIELSDIMRDLEDKNYDLELSQANLEKTLVALRKNEQFSSSLLTNSPNPIIVINPDSSITYVNPALEELTGFSSPELIGRKAPYPWWTEETLQQTSGDLKRAVRQGVWKLKELFQRKNGEQFWVEITSTPIRSNGGIKYYLVNWVDITERTKVKEEKSNLEAQLQQAQRMESIGTLAGGIAHDFNNIIAAITGYAELVQMDIPEANETSANLNEVLKAANRAKDLVKQILSFSQQSKGEQKPLQISLVAKEALKLLRASIPTTIEIRQDIKKESGTVLADPTQIHQVIMNLCTNAGHAMRENGGVLEVSLVNVDLDVDVAAQYVDLKPGPYARLTVSDTGCGMDHAVKERIFDPFFTTKGLGEGTGMGLAVVHGIVNNHGGAISVNSEPGKGTTFQVLLPRVESRVRLEAEKIEPLSTGSERILFVDDEKALVNIGEQMLKRLGYEVVGRTSSIEALGLFQNQPDLFDLVITDMTMPNMTGEELAKELMNIRPDIPVILCTGYSERISEEKAKGMGIRAFAMKPLLMRDLAKTIRKVLDKD